MEAREALERAHQVQEHAASRDPFSRRTALVVAALGILLAFASIGGKGAVTKMLLFQQQAADANNVVESNDVKLHINESQAAAATAIATGDGAAAREFAAGLQRQSETEYRPAIERNTARLARLEQQRDQWEHHYEDYEIAETILQVAIVITSVAVLSRSGRLIGASMALGGIGAYLLLDAVVPANLLPF